MRSEHPGTIRRMVLLLRAVSVTPGIRIIQASRLGGQTFYEMRVEPEDIVRLAESTGFHPASKETLKERAKKKCCRNALMRGAFLGCGTIVDPKYGYLMEWVMQSHETAQSVLRCLRTCYSLRLGIAERKNSWVVYCKDSAGMMRILTEIGAHAAVLAIENMLILKNARNQANRAYNCDSGNIQKMVGASQRQMDAIAAIQRSVGLGRLSKPLRDAALARIEHPGASLDDLGKVLTPPIGKSGMSHRLRRIEEIAKILSEEREGS